LHYADGEKRYVLGWKNAMVGTTVITGETSPITAGNRKQLKHIPE